LLDNGRSRILADAENREVLRCIRCGGCLSVCPVFRTVGGHAYGTTYPGPIGLAVTPLLRGVREWGHLSFASSLCEACTETCPTRIELHKLILRNRRDYDRVAAPAFERAGFRMFVFLARRPALFRLAGRLAALGRPFYPLVGWVPFNYLRRWSRSRVLPRVSFAGFGGWWKKHGKGGKGG
jgi:L-lactate dehydrogenase complex protein LldF